MCGYFCIGLIDFILKRKSLFVNMKWLTEISKICPEEHLLIKYYVIKYLLLIKIQNINRYQRGITSMVYNFLIKRLLVMLLKVKLF